MPVICIYIYIYIYSCNWYLHFSATYLYQTFSYLSGSLFFICKFLHRNIETLRGSYCSFYDIMLLQKNVSICICVIFINDSLFSMKPDKIYWLARWPSRCYSCFFSVIGLVLYLHQCWVYAKTSNCIDKPAAYLVNENMRTVLRSCYQISLLLHKWCVGMLS